MGGDWLRRRGPALLVVAVLAAAAGGAAGGLGAPAWLAGALAAVTALVSGVFAGWYFPARDQRRGLFEARDRLLDELADAVTDPRDARADPLALLRADRSPMPFRGRGRELRQLTEWRDRGPRGGKGSAPARTGSPVALLSGPAGVGKSRLALEFASRRPGGWAAGWLHAGAGAAAIGAAAACGESAVILVDDADGRDDILALLEALAERRDDPVIRVVLVTRSADGLRLALERQLDPRHAWVIARAERVELKPEGGSDDRARWFGEAVRAFATALGMTPPALPEVFTAGRGDPVEPFVMIQARALLAVLGSEPDGQGAGPGSGGGRDAADGPPVRSSGQVPDPRALSFGEVAEALLAHEKRRWRAAAPSWGLDGTDQATLATVETLQGRSIAALALLGDDGDEAAKAVLKRVPEMSDQPAMRLYAIAAAVRTLYPAGPDGAPRMQPDVIGEWFVVGQLTGNPALAAALRTGMSDEQAARALGLLARAADWIEAAGPLFGAFAGGDVRRQVLAATQAALAGETGRYLLDTVVAGQLAATADWSLDQLHELDALIPGYVLLETHVQIDSLVVAVFRAAVADDPGAYQAGLAAALISLALSLDRLGRYRQALDATQEAVALYRALAAADPDPHQADLATALDNLGNRFGKLGRYRQALGPAQEAAALWRALTAVSPDAHQASLATALNNLGAWLGRLGRLREALDAAREAVAIRRALATANPGPHQVGLATELNNLGTWLSGLGLHREALDATQEAAAIWRALAAANPDAYQGSLADALNNLAIRLGRVRRLREALEPAQEAVTIRRALVAANPGAHQGDLADALDNLATRFDGLGRYPEALDATREAVALYRALAAASPDVYQASLALALNNLGIWLGRLGRDQEALDIAQEAVALYRLVIAVSPDAHQADFANALNNLAARLHGPGRYGEALDAAQEAVALYRALAAADPGAYRPNLANVLSNLSVAFDLLDRDDEALAAREEAAAIYRELAAQDPELYEAEYRRKLGALRREYDRRGRAEEAIGHDLSGPLAAPPPGEADGGESAEPVLDESS